MKLCDNNHQDALAWICKDCKVHLCKECYIESIHFEENHECIEI